MSWKKGELLKATGLYLLIVPFFNVLNATGYVSAQIQGHFGATSVEFMYINLVPVFVMIAGLPLALELAKQFPLKSMMLCITIAAIILNTLSAFAGSITEFIVYRSLLTFCTIFGIVAALIPIVVLYNPKLNMAIMYGIVQFIIQGSSHIYKFIGTEVADIYDWKTSLLLLNLNLFLCLLLTFIFIRKDVAIGKQPFQFDFKGWFLLILIFLPLVFLSAEGQNREWFGDPLVSIACGLLLVMMAIYVYYSGKVKNPLIDLQVFRYKNVLYGTLFFFLIGIANGTGSVITGFMGNVLGFDDLYMANTHLYILIGLIISIPFCTYLMYKRVYLSIAAIFGFSAFALYHFMMYYRFYPGIGQNDFILPFVMKGIGIGFLYVLSALYISENVPKQLSTSRMMSGVISRIIIATVLCGSVLSTVISNVITQHKTGISQQLTNENKEAYTSQQYAKNYYLMQGMKPVEAAKMSDNSLQADMKEPATLLTYKDVYLVMGILSLLPILLIFISGAGNRSLQSIEVEPIPL